MSEVERLRALLHEVGPVDYTGCGCCAHPVCRFCGAEAKYERLKGEVYADRVVHGADCRWTATLGERVTVVADDPPPPYVRGVRG